MYERREVNQAQQAAASTQYLVIPAVTAMTLKVCGAGRGKGKRARRGMSGQKSA